jgi:S-(hydroxymethyl)glutathione dehydrogenase/alcohol dehydrogenase
MTDGSFRFRSSSLSGAPGGGLGGFCALGTFSQYAVVGQDSCVKVDPAIALQAAALVSCGVLTGWGAAARTAGVHTGDTVVVVGLGGIGMNAVQGARLCGAACIVAVDPVAAKRDLARRLGATELAATLDEAAEIAAARNPVGRGADATIVCTGNLSTDVVTGAFAATGKGGSLVIAGMSHDPEELNVQLPGTVLAGTERRVLGSFLGSCNPVRDVPLLLGLYQRGQLVLDELISRRYRLEEITDGYADLAAGRNVRGLIDFGTDQPGTWPADHHGGKA